MNGQEWDQAGADPDAYPPGVDPYPPEDLTPTDYDLVSDHGFRPLAGSPQLCGHRGEFGDFPCGFRADEHERVEVTKCRWCSEDGTPLASHHPGGQVEHKP